MFRKAYRWGRLDRFVAEAYKLRHLDIAAKKSSVYCEGRWLFMGGMIQELVGLTKVQGALDTSSC